MPRATATPPTSRHSTRKEGGSMFALEYAAVRHVLTAPQIAARAAPYLGEDDFDFDGLWSEAKTMSGGEALLVGIAFELWRAKKRVGLWELVRRLDATL